MWAGCMVYVREKGVKVKYYRCWFSLTRHRRTPKEPKGLEVDGRVPVSLFSHDHQNHDTASPHIHMRLKSVKSN